ncbi:FGGY family carbohydrate kinase [Shigella sonnei]
MCEEGIRIDSIGIDTSGVDSSVLLDQQGQRVGLPVAYRDSRTNGLMAQAQQQLGKRVFINVADPVSALQYDLSATVLTEQQPELIPHIAHALLIPYYFSHRLTGKMNWEYTNATTTNWSDQ